MSRDLLFEIGVEELPAGYIPPALEQLERGIAAGLADARLAYGAVRTRATPRRLALYVESLEERQPDRDEEVMGPAARVAFDAEGKPTRALLGFCQGKGADLADVRRVETPKGEYVAVTVHQAGRSAAEVLPALLAGLARGLTFPKVMRWLDDDTRFARPVRWLVALLGEEVLPVRAFGLEAGRESRGHRFLSPAPVTLARAQDYLAALEQVSVMAAPLAMRARIAKQVATVAAERGGRPVADEELLEICSYLVEWPTAFAGSFDAHYLDLPREVIVTALREHQRFFAVEREDGTLLPCFIAVRNGDERGLDVIRKGNEDVLIARLEDAKFYWDADLKHPPAARVEALAGVVWMEGLGSLREKAARLESLAGLVAQRIAPAAAEAATRAALLCKTDLLSEMIGSGKEYASLEGVMGGHYARRAGEPEDVAAAIADHYRPRGPADSLPVSDAGAVLAIADKLDHVAGAFVAGKLPSGSEDPYGVRRAANGVVRVLIESGLHLDLGEATEQALAPFLAANPALAKEELLAKLGAFWRDRVRGAIEERGVRYDACDAALEARLAGATGGERPGWRDPPDSLRRGQVMDAFRGDERFEPLVVLFKRVANILAKATETLPDRLDPARLAEPLEQELAAALERARARTEPLWRTRDYEAILPALLEMEQVIHGFFEAVLVNAEDLPTRLNRLRLLSEVRALFVRGWDLSKIVVEGEKGQ
jgi:glycyl-tRNA synthetase beta chain